MTNKENAALNSLSDGKKRCFQVDLNLARILKWAQNWAALIIEREREDKVLRKLSVRARAQSNSLSALNIWLIDRPHLQIFVITNKSFFSDIFKALTLIF